MTAMADDHIRVAQQGVVVDELDDVCVRRDVEFVAPDDATEGCDDAHRAGRQGVQRTLWSISGERCSRTVLKLTTTNGRSSSLVHGNETGWAPVSAPSTGAP